MGVHRQKPSVTSYIHRCKGLSANNLDLYTPTLELIFISQIIPAVLQSKNVVLPGNSIVKVV